MRRLLMHDLLAEKGAVFETRAGAEVVLRFSDPESEYRAVREAVGLCDLSHANRFSVPEQGLDLLERYGAGSVANIRFGRVLHTLAADEDGHIEYDLYVANDDESFIVIGESLKDEISTRAQLEQMGAAEAGVEWLGDSTVMFGLDGCNAWAVARDLFGDDVLGLPYLSLESYTLDAVEIKLLRAGKTSEFGYLLIVPAESGAAVWKRIEAAGVAHGLEPVGLAAHETLRLDGRFFNIYAEGASVQDPLALGLQWMIDFDSESFRGRDAILARRAAGLEQKIIGVVPDDAEGALETGDEITHEGRRIAKVVTSGFSGALGRRIGLALFEIDYAYSGLTFERKDGGRVQTVSMPPFVARSLSVKLDGM